MAGIPPLTYFFQQESGGREVVDFQLLESDSGPAPTDGQLDALKAASSNSPELLEYIERVGAPIETQFTSNSLTITTPTIFFDLENSGSFALFEIVLEDAPEPQTSVPEPGILLGLVGMVGLGVRRLTSTNHE